MKFTKRGGKKKNNYAEHYFLSDLLTFPSEVLFSTQISSAGLTEGVPEAGIGGIPGGKIIPGGGGRFPMGGGRKGGLCNRHKCFVNNF